MIKKIKLNKRESFKYNGEVKVDLLLGDKICKTVTGHNAGKKPLFEFLALCLVNQYRVEQRPNFIRLFTGNDETELKELTNSAITHSGVSIDSGTDSNGDWAKATFRFLIPYSALSLLYASGETDITYLKLYSPVNYNIKENESVIYKLNEPIVIPDNSNINIQVSWSLKLSN